MNRQQQEAERLNKELLEQRAELALLRSALENKEMVRLNVEYLRKLLLVDQARKMPWLGTSVLKFPTNLPTPPSGQSLSHFHNLLAAE